MGDVNIGPSSASIAYNGVKFSVYRNSAETPGSTAPILFDTKEFDTGSNVDIVTNLGRFTAPVAGFYSFTGTLTMAYGGSGNLYSIALYKNGSIAKQGDQKLSTAVQTICGQVSVANLQLAAADFVEIYTLGVSTAITTGSAFTNFSGFLVSRA